MSVSQKLKSAASALALATALICTNAFAEALTDETSSKANSSINETVQDEAKAQIDERRKTLIDDATLALKKTEEALTALNDGDTLNAIDALAIATGKLETVVARDPGLALAPVSVKLIQHDMFGDVEAIKTVRDSIMELVEVGQIQKARPLLREFASEVVVETTNLPLATYPSALLRAVALIEADEIQKAKQTLVTALNTVVVTEDVIPLPVLRAERFIDAAEAELGEGGDSTTRGDSSDAAIEIESSDETPEPASLSPTEYVQAAREQLNLAEALGYGDEGEFAELHNDLRQLDEKIDAEQGTEGILGTIRDSFSRFKDRFIGKES